ncbi:hypothetical protein [Salinicoccus sp. HZC-1]|uniref:hypothetical protein n=1 Tax=Salinicoccus sp. HZC-1 TaxID=3385497 RepID=UPI00398A5579
MKLFKWDFLKIIRNKKTQIILIALLIFLASYSTLYQDRTVQLPVEEIRTEYEETQRLFRAIPSEDFETETGQEIYEKLARQQHILGMQRYILGQKEGNTVEGLEEIVDDYVGQGIEMTENQLSFYEAEDFPSYELLTGYLPSEEELRDELKFLQYLKENNVEIDWNPMSPSLVLYSLVNLIAGVFIYIIAAVFGSDRFARDQENNWSVSQGIPYSWAFQWRQRTFISWLLIWLTIIAGTVISYFMNTLAVNTGTLNYPVKLYSAPYTEYISIFDYTVVVMLLTMALSYVIVKFATGLSWVFRNIYVTIAIVTGIFFIPYLFLVIPAVSAWNPLLYLQIQPVLEGLWTDAGKVDIPKLIMSIIMLYVLVEVAFHFIFKLIPTRNGKLKRRKN